MKFKRRRIIYRRGKKKVRERETDRQTKTERKRQREREKERERQMTGMIVISLKTDGFQDLSFHQRMLSKAFLGKDFKLFYRRHPKIHLSQNSHSTTNPHPNTSAFLRLIFITQFLPQNFEKLNLCHMFNPTKIRFLDLNQFISK